ncbi:MAG TPA: DUF4166 domain-containing protein [Asticcacaulis sp.]|nr:DUF4166 domain-containing protein [Asticcacaulis sp.]
MTDPIFAGVFADQWSRLPPALLQHYANRPFSHDRVTVKGTLNIRMGPMMRVVAPLMAALGMLTPQAGDNIPCTVHFLSEPDSKALVFERWFEFPGGKSYQFRSRLVPIRPHEVIEYMPCGIGWRCNYFYNKDKVIMRHRDYVWRLFGRDVPLLGLGELLFGRGGAYEQATGDSSFRMRMATYGGLFMEWMDYSYEGEFMITEMALAG